MMPSTMPAGVWPVVGRWRKQSRRFRLPSADPRPENGWPAGGVAGRVRAERVERAAVCGGHWGQIPDPGWLGATPPARRHGDASKTESANKMGGGRYGAGRRPRRFEVAVARRGNGRGGG